MASKTAPSLWCDGPWLYLIWQTPSFCSPAPPCQFQFSLASGYISGIPAFEWQWHGGPTREERQPVEPVLLHMTESWLPVPYLGDFLFRVVKIFDSCSISLSGPMTRTWQALPAHSTLACVFRIPLLWEERMKLQIAACNTALVCFYGRDQRCGRGDPHAVHYC